MKGFTGFLLGVSVSMNLIELCYIIKHRKKMKRNIKYTVQEAMDKNE